jgi:hydrogenase expression/formation protein HypC
MCLAIPAKLTRITDDTQLQRTGEVDIDGVRKEVNLSFVPEAQPGDYLLIHAGIALNTVDESEARKVFEYLAEIAQIEVESD